MNVVSLSLLKYFTAQFNAFSILIKHLSHTMVIAFVVWGVATKLVQISFSFFTISWVYDSLLVL